MLGTADTPLSSLLAENIRDPAIRSMVESLMDTALVALRDLSSLDEAIFSRLAGGGSRAQSEDPGALYPVLFASTFAGVRKLLAYTEHAWLLGATPAPEPEGDLDFELPLEEAPAGPGAPRLEAQLALEDFDIDAVLDSIQPASPTDEFERFSQLRSHVATIDYGLKAQVDAFRAQLDEALRRGHASELMGILDDGRNAASDGIFALVTAVCGTFMPAVEASALLPEYRTQLQRALAVRWNLSHLAAAVAQHNAAIQDLDTPPARAEAVYQRLLQTVDRFCRSPAFRVMRPTDRWEIVNFQRLLAGRTMTQARHTCEGLDKYLESLRSINQREVLIQHDYEVIKEVGELLEAAHSLLAISGAGSVSLVRQALQAAARLHGRNRALDHLLNQAAIAPPPVNSPPALERFISDFQAALRA